MRDDKVRNLVISAICLALALVLPFLTGQIPEIGKMLSPMHIPVLLCGFICGPGWGLLVGLIAPLMRSLLFGMPVMFPNAIGMMFELACYGFAAGWLYRLLPKKPWRVYVSLIGAMILGRIVWGIARVILWGLGSSPFSWKLFIAGALTNAVPGIILHIVLIPLVVLGLERSGFIRE
nr:ECF transporter S component [Lachnospiraceae bacterium]